MLPWKLFSSDFSLQICLIIFDVCIHIVAGREVWRVCGQWRENWFNDLIVNRQLVKASRPMLEVAVDRRWLDTGPPRGTSTTSPSCRGAPARGWCCDGSCTCGSPAACPWATPWSKTVSTKYFSYAVSHQTRCKSSSLHFIETSTCSAQVYVKRCTLSPCALSNIIIT